MKVYLGTSSIMGIWNRTEHIYKDNCSLYPDKSGNIDYYEGKTIASSKAALHPKMQIALI